MVSTHVFAAFRNIEADRDKCDRLHMDAILEATPVYVAKPPGSGHLVRVRPERGEVAHIEGERIWEAIQNGQEGERFSLHVIVQYGNTTVVADSEQGNVGMMEVKAGLRHGTGLYPAEIDFELVGGTPPRITDIRYDSAELEATKTVGYPIMGPMVNSENPTYVALPVGAVGAQLPGVLVHDLGRQAIMKRVDEMSNNYVLVSGFKQEMTEVMDARTLFAVDESLAEYVRCLEDFVSLDVFRARKRVFLATTRRGLYRVAIVRTARLVNARALLSGATREPKLVLTVFALFKAEPPVEHDTWWPLKHPVEVTEHSWFEPLDKTQPLPEQLWYHMPPAPLSPS